MEQILKEVRGNHQQNNSILAKVYAIKSKPSLSELCLLQPESIKPNSRTDIMFALRQALRSQTTPLPNIHTDRLITLAHYLSDWPFLIQLQESEHWPLRHENDADWLIPYFQLGDFVEAENKLNIALQAQPLNATLQQLQKNIFDFKEKMPSPLSDLKREDIRLTPLDYHHADDFSWQYADPDIATLCSLPQFQSAEHWLNWLHGCNENKHQHIFAIIHESLGFIGSVCLYVHQGLGYFYYWLGSDFQGQGFGPKAGNILFNFGKKHLQMQCCFTKILNHNKPSHKAIAKLGFTQLPFRALPPHENESFYYRGKHSNLATLHQQFGWLMEQHNSSVSLMPFQQR